MEEIRFPARDGYELAGTLYRPEKPAGPAVLINSATAVPRGYYRKFAAMLRDRGCTVLTYDYRGIGGSRPEELRGFPARMRDWGTLDLAGAADFLLERYPGLPLVEVGHSAGGQLPGLDPDVDRAVRMLFVSCQSGYWQLFDAPFRYQLYLLWRVVLPAATRLVGYLPARSLGLGEDLPQGVLLEWSAWGLTPGYMFGDPSLETHHGAFEGKLLSLSVSDDAWASKISVDALAERYENARVQRRHVTPGDAAVARLGHFGFFKLDPENPLWAECADWLMAKGAT